MTSELNIWFALFDNPWVVVAILVASGVANWLAQRRAKKTEGEADPEAEAPPPAAPGWQEKLRELLQEAQSQSQPTDPPKPPRGEGAPPVLRRTTPPEVIIVPPVITARESQPRPLRPRPVAVVAPSRFQGYAMDHVKSPPARPARSVVPPVRKTGPRPGKLQQTLRRSDTARQAFLASLVFGPPKGLET